MCKKEETARQKTSRGDLLLHFFQFLYERLLRHTQALFIVVASRTWWRGILSDRQADIVILGLPESGQGKELDAQ
jgi:hypothetical protein